MLPAAPLAQLDRAPDYGSGGLGFESLRACHFHSNFPQSFGGLHHSGPRHKKAALN